MATPASVQQGNSLLDGFNQFTDALFGVADRGVGLYNTFTNGQTINDVNRAQAAAAAGSNTPLSQSLAAKNTAVTLLVYGGIALAVVGGMIYFTKHA